MNLVHLSLWKSNKSMRLLLALGVCIGGGYALQNRAWPPPVQKVSDDSPALTPAEAMKTFHLAPGYRIELVAAEPMVQDPVAMDIGPDGRMWVVEMPGFAPDESGVDSREPTGRVVVLEDVNDDGKMDKRTVFMDKLILPRVVKVLDRRRNDRRAAESLAGARYRRRRQGRRERVAARQLRAAPREPRA